MCTRRKLERSWNPNVLSSDLEGEMASPYRADWKLIEPFEALDPPAPAPAGTDPVLLESRGP